MCDNKKTELRDQFAGLAMQSLIIASGKQTYSFIDRIKLFLGINGWETNFHISLENVSKSSYEFADEMLKQREL